MKSTHRLITVIIITLGFCALNSRADDAKPVNASRLMLEIDLKIQLSNYESISRQYTDTTFKARAPGTSEKELTELTNQLSFLIAEKKALEESIPATAKKYNSTFKEKE